MQQIVRYEIVLPPQDPIVSGDQLRFGATLYLSEIAAEAFRRLTGEGCLAVEYRVSLRSSDAAPSFAGRAALGPSFGPGDISLALVVPSSAIVVGEPHVLVAACVGAGGFAGRDDASTAYLALFRRDGGWA